IMEKFKQKDTVTVLQYMDDLLVAGAEQSDVEEETVKLLNYLGQQGLQVYKRKVQFVEKEVKYLGHLISRGSRWLSPDRIAGIVELPVPKPVREVRQSL
ncbi:POLY protein, partial [Amazona guildingii]|nr:POLY protein [Amazona guildingii]